MYSKRLRELPLFNRLGKKDIEVLAGLADEVDISEGKVLTRQGDFGREFFVIEEGTAQVTRDGETVAELGPGDFFGEIALIEDVRRTATVTASIDLRFFVLTRQSFRSLIAHQPDVQDKVMATLARRVGDDPTLAEA